MGQWATRFAVRSRRRSIANKGSPAKWPPPPRRRRHWHAAAGQQPIVVTARGGTGGGKVFGEIGLDALPVDD